jgi:hypothetical protein
MAIRKSIYKQTYRKLSTFISCHQIVGQNIVGKNTSFENVANFKYFRMTVKSKLNMKNACCHAVHNSLSSHMLSKNVKIKIYETIILPVVLYGCETWSLTLKEEHRLRVLENRMFRRIFGLEMDEVPGAL